jgi:hypothetical protein
MHRVHLVDVRPLSFRHDRTGRAHGELQALPVPLRARRMAGLAPKQRTLSLPTENIVMRRDVR